MLPFLTLSNDEAPLSDLTVTADAHGPVCRIGPAEHPTGAGSSQLFLKILCGCKILLQNLHEGPRFLDNKFFGEHL